MNVELLVAGLTGLGSVGGGIAWVVSWVRDINAKLEACEARDHVRQNELSIVTMGFGLMVEEVRILSPRGNATLARVSTMFKSIYSPEGITPSWTELLSALEEADRRKHENGDT